MNQVRSGVVAVMYSYVYLQVIFYDVIRRAYHVNNVSTDELPGGFALERRLGVLEGNVELVPGRSGRLGIPLVRRMDRSILHHLPLPLLRREAGPARGDLHHITVQNAVVFRRPVLDNRAQKSHITELFPAPSETLLFYFLPMRQVE